MAKMNLSDYFKSANSTRYNFVDLHQSRKIFLVGRPHRNNMPYLIDPVKPIHPLLILNTHIEIKKQRKYAA